MNKIFIALGLIALIESLGKYVRASGSSGFFKVEVGGGSCVTACADGEWDNKNICTQCSITGCATCSSLTQCTACTKPLKLSVDGLSCL